MRDDDGDRVPQTEAEWVEAEAALRKRQDWSDAIGEKEVRRQAEAIQRWTDGHVRTTKPSQNVKPSKRFPEGVHRPVDVYTPIAGYTPVTCGTKKVYITNH